MAKDPLATFGIPEKDIKKQDEAKAEFDRKEKLRLNDMRKILSIPEGRRYVWSELERCKVFAPSFSLNNIQTAFNEGVRSIGISLLSDVEVAKPGSYTQMFSEFMSKENSAKQKEKEDGNTES